ncbi:LysR substrate-binding domain-containing protein [Marivita sp. XM-24bin2]|uniref:LysR substrate-binding domain-containing protein n=1 Tax=unclassified Marivita TaxID=2632480 RepID=UPI000D7936F4|nr:LysR substrate-binding domain-containing protein [Marivita sp. XM-24bin2]MCR9111445.1 LysR substrate-binding domain-containing protein [Paracoccaceae bacterium]PWL31595.1 MAG: LysR family transcriptional regulator [Marivita sp. XM-24bin2]
MFTSLPSLVALRALEAAVRLGSFKDAADELSVSPTAVSHHIRALEDDLGVGLFVRGTRQVTATAAAIQLSEAVNRGLSGIASAMDDCVLGEKLLTISTTPAFGALWLVPRLRKFQNLFPNYRIQLETGTVPVDLTRDRRLDVAIRYGAAQVESLATTPLCEETFGAFAAPAYLEAVSALGDFEFIETEWQQSGLLRIGWSAWFETAEVTITAATARIRSFKEEHHMVQCGIAGQGLILVSTLLVSDLVEQGLLAPFRPDVRLPGLTYTLKTTPETAASRKCRDFRRWIIAEISGHIPSGRSSIG